MSHKSKLACGTALTLSLFAASTALAQTRPASAAGTAPPPVPGGLRGAEGEPSLAEVVVTARRVEERLQDVPISITVFNQQQLTNRNVVTAADLANYTPSLTVNETFGAQNTTFAIRGFIQDIGTAPSVGVYFADVVAPRGGVSGVPSGDGAGPGSFFDLQNVQVLSGPQGTLFGRNTTGGAVLLVPQKPTDQFGGYVEGSAGNYDMKRVQGVINLPLSQTVRLRLGVDHQDRDGFIKNTTRIGATSFGSVRYTAARASLVADLTPKLENYLIGSYLHSNTSDQVQKLVACLPSTGLPFGAQLANPFGEAACAQLARPSVAGGGFYSAQSATPLNQTLVDQWQFINTTTFHASDNLTIKNIVSYAQYREDLRSSFFGTDFDLSETSVGRLLGVAPGTKAGFSATIPVPGGHTANESTFVEELQVQGNALDDKLTYQAGGYLESSRPLGLAGTASTVLLNCSNVETFTCANPIAAGNLSYTASRVSYHDVGLYAQSSYALTDRLKLTGGIRYTWDRIRNENQVRVYRFAFGPAQGQPIAVNCQATGATTPDCDRVITVKPKAPTWLLDLDYKPTDDMLVYAKWARGYRAGGIVPLAPLQFVTYEPEKVDDYEVGLKTTFRGMLAGTFNVTGFYNDFRNRQVQANLTQNPAVCLDPNNPNFSRCVANSAGIVNGGAARIWGVEVGSTISPFDGFTLDLGYTYLNTKLTSVNAINNGANDPILVTFAAVKGDPLILSPKNKVTVTGTYTLPLHESLGRISLAATFTHVDRQLINYVDREATISFAGQTVPVPPFVQSLSYLQPRNLLNLNLNWNSVAQSRVDLSLFATNVTNQHYYTAVPGFFDQSHVETVALGQPRMFGARVRYRFGD